jgi:ferric-dicitrate binding protein FerR (iron transport regulator)
MFKYRYYQVIDFAQDEEFILWVTSRDPNTELHRRWKSWLQENPDKLDHVEEARQMILAAVTEKEYGFKEQRQQQLWERIHDTIGDVPVEEFPSAAVRHVRWLSLYSVAATLTIIFLVTLYWFSNVTTVNRTATTLVRTEALHKDFAAYINNGAKVHVLILEDGTSISLQPNSMVEYPETFTLERREVYLNGQAFFNITKDAKRPFFVYANELVTQVLGTSFNIRAYEKEKDIVVTVRSGKVSVYTNHKNQDKVKDEGKADENNPNNISSATLLLPNHQVIYSREDSRMVKSLAEEPQVLSAAIDKEDFYFADTPISEVFKVLEEAYQVHIMYDEDVLQNCFLNASLGDRSFHDMLRIICKAINAQYEIMDAHVLITGSGCN